MQGIDITPVLNQINSDIRGFRGFGPLPPPEANSRDDVRFVAGERAAGIAGG